MSRILGFIFCLMGSAAVADPPEGYTFLPFDKAMEKASTETRLMFVYFGRYGTGNYPQRIFISTSTNGTVGLQTRGAQTTDPRNSGVATSIPGDHATDADYLKGNLLTVLGNQVFDLEVAIDGATHYGKIVIGNLVYADTTADKEDEAITLPLTILMQPLAGSYHYFQ